MILVERTARDPDKHHHDPEVNQVPAITPRIPVHQRPRRQQQIPPRLHLHHARPAQKLGRDRRNHRGSQRKRKQRKRRPRDFSQAALCCLGHEFLIDSRVAVAVCGSHRRRDGQSERRRQCTEFHGVPPMSEGCIRHYGD